MRVGEGRKVRFGVEVGQGGPGRSRTMTTGRGRTRRTGQTGQKGGDEDRRRGILLRSEESGPS